MFPIYHVPLDRRDSLSNSEDDSSLESEEELEDEEHSVLRDSSNLKCDLIRLCEGHTYDKTERAAIHQRLRTNIIAGRWLLSENPDHIQEMLSFFEICARYAIRSHEDDFWILDQVVFSEHDPGGDFFPRLGTLSSTLRDDFIREIRRARTSDKVDSLLSKMRYFQRNAFSEEIERAAQEKFNLCCILC